MENQRNLTLSEAAGLQPGDRVTYAPDESGQAFPNQEVFKDLKPGETYTVVDKKLFGVREHSAVLQELSVEDLEGRTITDEY